MAAILQVFVLLPSFLRHLKALGKIYLLLCQNCGTATTNLAEVDDLFHLCCNRMASDLMRSQEWLPFRKYFPVCLHSCAI